MKAILILADAARAHGDGTFSLLRGGIDRLTVEETQPAILKASLLARMTFDIGEGGSHTFKVSIVNEDGLPVAPESSGTIDAPVKGGSFNLVSDLQLIFPKPGSYAFNLFLDNRIEHTWALKVEVKKPRGKGKK